MIGRTVAQYKITAKLGEGGMGAVYRAEDQKLDRTVALKFVLSSLGAGMGGQERLMREAKACAALNHPNITTIYDFGEDESHPFIVMEFVEGTTLQDAVRERTFEAQEIATIGIQIADALSAAHAKGIIHRDLKSANVMLAADGRVKVMDFGLAKPAESSFVTQTGATLGTAAYMSPEQVRAEELTPQSDLYSLGVVLYELATGMTPYPHAHQLAVMYAVANEEPVPPRERNPAIPEALEAAILKAMAKKPEDRCASCQELAAALRQMTDRAGLRAPDRGGGMAAGNGVGGPAGDRGIGSGSIAGSSTPRLADRLRGLPLSQAAFIRKRWFRVGVPVVVIAVAAAVALFTQGSLLPEGLGGGTPQLTASAHVENGYAHMVEGRFHEAHAEMLAAVDSDPSSSEAWSALAAASARLEAFEDAVMQSARAIELDPRNTEAHYNLAISLEESGNSEDALAAYSEAVRLDSSFTEAYSAWGHLLIELGRTSEAIPLLQRGLERSPESDYAFLLHKNLGKAHLMAGRHDASVPHLIESLQAEPDWPETTALLAQAYEAAGMRAEARELWRRYVELETDPEKLEAARERLAAE